ncbi:transposase [Pontibacter sp. 13R65]|uniref:transposase n=1 Tax=Pontibacter sp. 13R65 TaxID=3127458 RepID=UPI00301BF25D
MEDRKSKERIIAEYLASGLSYRQAAPKYGVNFRTLHRWVKQHKGQMKKPTKAVTVKPVPVLPPGQESLPTDVKLLQAELRKARLHTQVLEQVIAIAEEELGLSIRKKSGTKQS